MKIRRFISIALSMILLASVCCPAVLATAPAKPDVYYVYDEAGVLSDETEKHIIDQNTKLSAATDAEIVVAAIKTTGNEPINEFAVNMYIDWQIGDSGKLNGVLLLLVIDDDKYWVVQGTGIEDKLTSGKIRTMFDNCLEPYFSAKDYDKGAVGTFDLLLEELVSIYDVDLNKVDAEEEGTGVWFIILMILLGIIGVAVIGFIVLIIIRKLSEDKYRSKDYRPGKPITTQTRRPQPPPNRLPAGNRPGAPAPRPMNGQRPAGTPRPGGNMPHPNGNMPRPGGNMPRPNGNMPRPGGNMPRPNGNVPRPGGNMPRPNGNMPRPGQENRPPRP